MKMLTITMLTLAAMSAHDPEAGAARPTTIPAWDHLPGIVAPARQVVLIGDFGLQEGGREHHVVHLVIADLLVLLGVQSRSGEQRRRDR